jgi:hypothetical protein
MLDKPQDRPTILFCTNGDGTVTCSWCDEVFNADLAVPDGSDDPICPTCALMGEDDVKEQLMKLDTYTVTVRVADPQDDETAVEATYHNCPRETLLETPIINNLLKTLEESVREEVGDAKP